MVTPLPISDHAEKHTDKCNLNDHAAPLTVNLQKVCLTHRKSSNKHHGAYSKHSIFAALIRGRCLFQHLMKKELKLCVQTYSLEEL